MSDVHTALRIIEAIDAQGGPRQVDASRYSQLRAQVLSVMNASGSSDLGDGNIGDELGAWPIIVAQLAAIAAGAYVTWHIAAPVVEAAKIAGPVVTYGSGLWLLWWLFTMKRAPRRKARTVKTTTYEDADPYASGSGRHSLGADARGQIDGDYYV